VDPKIAEDQVRIQVVLKDGRKLDKYIEHAVGSLTNPMTDRDLEGKFSGLAEGILPKDQSRRVMDLCWKIADLPDAADITRSAAAL
jgi:2-methylcitrate dehydratase PrpD